ncbi:MAG TPA: hypothetical protein EYP62_02515 [Kiritimatiellae bacterium]|nr:hypothetical protein [Kiritimatiellia bacterium]
MLALWPVDAVCDGRLSLGKARSCRNKLSELEAALEEGKSAAVWFDEDEINSYLAGLIWARRLPMPPYWRVCVEAAVLDLTGGGFRMTARILWGPLRATLRLTGTSGGPAYDAALVVKSLAIGRLPLPPRWTGAVVQALAGDAGELERVRRILENLVLIRLEDHRMLCGV